MPCTNSIAGLLVGVAPGDQAQHVDLTLGEARGASYPRRAARLPGGLEHGVDLDPPEPAGVDLVEQLRRGLTRAERAPVGPVLAHGVVGVGRRQQSSAQGELIARSAAVVTGAVGPLVVAGGNLGEGGEGRAAVQDPLAEIRVEPDSFPLFGAQRARAIPDPARDTNAADVVQQGRSTERCCIGAGHACGLGGADRECRDTGRVVAKERRLQVGEVRHRGEGAVEVVHFNRQHGSRLGLEGGGAHVVADLDEPALAVCEQSVHDRGVISATASMQ